MESWWFIDGHWLHWIKNMDAWMVWGEYIVSHFPEIWFWWFSQVFWTIAGTYTLDGAFNPLNSLNSSSHMWNALICQPEPNPHITRFTPIHQLVQPPTLTPKRWVGFHNWTQLWSAMPCLKLPSYARPSCHVCRPWGQGVTAFFVIYKAKNTDKGNQ